MITHTSGYLQQQTEQRVSRLVDCKIKTKPGTAVIATTRWTWSLRYSKPVLAFMSNLSLKKREPSTLAAFDCNSHFYIAKFHFLLCAMVKFKYFERDNAMNDVLWECFFKWISTYVLCFSPPDHKYTINLYTVWRKHHQVSPYLWTVQHARQLHRTEHI